MAKTAQQTASELRESEARFRALVDSAFQGVVIHDHGIILEANAAFAAMVGREVSELIGQQSLDFAVPDSRAAQEQHIRDGYQGMYEVVGHRPDGTLRYLEIVGRNVTYHGRPVRMAAIRDITERKQSEAAEHELRQLAEALRDTAAALNSTLDFDEVLERILVNAERVVPHQSSSIMLVEDGFLRAVKSRGYAERGLEAWLMAQRFPVEQFPNRGIMTQTRMPLVVPDTRDFPDWRRLPETSWIRSHVGAPIIVKQRVIGFINLDSDQPGYFTSAHGTRLQAFADQAAVALENARLLTELEGAYDATIEGWSRALDLRDKETEGHTRRVTDMTLRLARQLGFSEADRLHVRRGALLHDIGKMGIPDSILLKPDLLTEAEREIMERHPRYALELLSPIAYLRPALDIPYCHHEKWDGTGYPRGLKGADIPLAARVFAVVDVWDALRSDRPYRAGWPPEKVREHLRALSGIHFDPQVVTAFLALDL